MRILDYGMIGLNGSVVRPEPSANFADYQNSLATYQLKLHMRRRVRGHSLDVVDPADMKSAVVKPTCLD
ncbi:MAG: hypothetical protein ACR2PA_25910 [Hyphomicrobiaceae bacterium]